MIESHDLDHQKYDEQQDQLELERLANMEELERYLVENICSFNDVLDLDDILAAVRNALQVSQDGKFRVEEL